MGLQESKSSVRKLALDIWLRRRWRAVFVVGLMVVMSLAEGIGMALLFPLLNKLGITGTSVQSPMIDFLNRVVPGDTSIWLISSVLVAIFGIQGLLFVVQSWYVAKLQRGYMAEWQKTLFAGLLCAQWYQSAKRPIGEYINAIVTETGRLAGAVMTLAQLISTLIVAVVYIAIAFLVSFQVTLGLLAIAFTMFFAVFAFYRKSHEIGMLAGPANARLQIEAGEWLGGLRLIKSFSVESAVMAKYGATVDFAEKVHRTATFLPSLVRGIFEFGAIAALVILLAISSGRPDIGTANLMVVMALFVRLLPRFTTVQLYIHNLNNYAPAFDIAETLRGEMEACKENGVSLIGASAHSGVGGPGGRKEVKKHGRKNGPLKVTDLEVQFDGVRILESINFQINRNGVYGIVGESGAGKTTLLNALLGLIPISTGEINLGDNKISEAYLPEWRSHFGFIPQENTLFNMSIQENIALGMEGSEFDSIVIAARRAGAHGFIEKFADGYDTIAGDGGGRFSGGQKQRICIARALLRNPEILLMDEPTSALDAESEIEVLDSIRSLAKELAVVIVTHRISAIRESDGIIVIRDGKVSDAGTWDRLITENDYFRKLAILQGIS